MPMLFFFLHKSKQQAELQLTGGRRFTTAVHQGAVNVPAWFLKGHLESSIQKHEYRYRVNE